MNPAVVQQIRIQKCTHMMVIICHQWLFHIHTDLVSESTYCCIELIEFKVDLSMCELFHLGHLVMWPQLSIFQIPRPSRDDSWPEGGRKRPNKPVEVNHGDSSGRGEDATKAFSNMAEHHHRVDRAFADGNFFCRGGRDHGPPHGTPLPVPSRIPLCLWARQRAIDSTPLWPFPCSLSTEVYRPPTRHYTIATHRHRNRVLHLSYGGRRVCGSEARECGTCTRAPRPAESYGTHLHLLAHPAILLARKHRDFYPDRATRVFLWGVAWPDAQLGHCDLPQHDCVRPFLKQCACYSRESSHQPWWPPAMASW